MLKSKQKVKTNEHTIQKSLGFLKDAFLFLEAKRWNVKGQEVIDYPMKYYCGISSCGMHAVGLEE